jgi:hypothetical protein
MKTYKEYVEYKGQFIYRNRHNGYYCTIQPTRLMADTLQGIKSLINQEKTRCR